MCEHVFGPFAEVATHKGPTNTYKAA